MIEASSESRLANHIKTYQHVKTHPIITCSYMYDRTRNTVQIINLRLFCWFLCKSETRRRARNHRPHAGILHAERVVCIDLRKTSIVCAHDMDRILTAGIQAGAFFIVSILDLSSPVLIFQQSRSKKIIQADFLQNLSTSNQSIRTILAADAPAHPRINHPTRKM